MLRSYFYFGHPMAGKDALGMVDYFLCRWLGQLCNFDEPGVVINNEYVVRMIPFEQVCADLLPRKLG